MCARICVYRVCVCVCVLAPKCAHFNVRFSVSLPLCALVLACLCIVLQSFRVWFCCVCVQPGRLLHFTVCLCVCKASNQGAGEELPLWLYTEAVSRATVVCCGPHTTLSLDTNADTCLLYKLGPKLLGTGGGTRRYWASYRGDALQKQHVEEKHHH